MSTGYCLDSTRPRTKERGGLVASNAPSRVSATCRRAALVGMMGLLANCGDSTIVAPPEELPASLEIHIATLGRFADSDGYTLRINGDSVAHLGSVANMFLPDLPPGEAVLSISDVGHFCHVAGSNPRVVALEPGTTTNISFQILCDPFATVPLSAFESIEASNLRDRVFDLAADSTLGRSTWDPEIVKVADYLATAFAASGLEPARPEGFVQWWVDGVGRTGPNVVGWLPGSDPELRSEYVILVAHFDHLGYRPGLYPDSVYNGADDNASGTAALVELAEAFALLEPAPRRSIVFLAVSGEESGLLGSEAYVGAPAFPLEATHAVMNIDMIGRGTPGSIYVGQTESSVYGPLAIPLAERLPLGITVVPRPGGRLGNSDGRSFASKGIDVVDFFSGFHAEYHTRNDEAELLEYENMERVVRLAFLLGVEMASWHDVQQPGT